MTTDPGTTLFIVLCIVLIGWYAIGAILNRARAQDFLRALKSALPELGARASYRWRTSAGVEVRILEPVEPFAQIAIQVILEPREVLLLWLFNHFVRGRRDQFVLRAQFNRKPTFEFLLADAESALGRVFLDQPGERGTSLERAATGSGRRFEYSGRSRTQRQWAESLLRGIEDHDWPIWVVSYHKRDPHLIFVSGLPSGGHSALAGMFGLIRSTCGTRAGGPADERAEDHPMTLPGDGGGSP